VRRRRGRKAALDVRQHGGGLGLVVTVAVRRAEHRLVRQRRILLSVVTRAPVGAHGRQASTLQAPNPEIFLEDNDERIRGGI
jgi:hypothetical protein